MRREKMRQSLGPDFAELGIFRAKISVNGIKGCGGDLSYVLCVCGCVHTNMGGCYWTVIHLCFIVKPVTPVVLLNYSNCLDLSSSRKQTLACNWST